MFKSFLKVFLIYEMFFIISKRNKVNSKLKSFSISVTVEIKKIIISKKITSDHFH